MTRATLRVKRVYAEPSRNDGRRILVDAMWPRGLSKEDAMLEAWHREIAPSTTLRKWFGHDPDKWEEFQERYFAELDGNAEAVERLRTVMGEGRVTLLFAAKDERHNNAVALKRYLEGG